MFRNRRIRHALGLIVSADPAERERGILTLAELRAPEADRIRPRLVDLEPRVRSAAATALAMLGDERWQQWVQGAVDADFSNLATAGDPEAVDVLTRGLIDPFADQIRAAIAAAQLGAAVVRERLAAWATEKRTNTLLNETWRTPGPALQLLLHIDTEPVAEAIVRWLPTGPSDSRSFVATLNQMSCSQRVLVRLAASTDHRRAEYAFKLLGEAGPALMLRLIADGPDKVCIRGAAEWIKYLSRKQLEALPADLIVRAATVLIEHAQASEPDLSVAASRALRELGEASLGQLLRIARESPELGQRVWAVNEIAQMPRQLVQDAQDVLSLVISGLSDPTLEYREACAKVAGRLGPQGKPAIPALVDIVRCNKLASCRSACEALQTIGHDAPFLFHDCYRKPASVTARLTAPNVIDGPDAAKVFQRGYTVLLDELEAIVPSRYGKYYEWDLMVAEEAIVALEALIVVAGKRFLTQSLCNRLMRLPDLVAAAQVSGRDAVWMSSTFLTTRGIRQKLREAFGKQGPRPVLATAAVPDSPHAGYCTSPRDRHLSRQIAGGNLELVRKGLPPLRDPGAVGTLIAVMEKEVHLLRATPHTTHHTDRDLDKAAEAAAIALAEWGRGADLLDLYRRARHEHPTARFRVMNALNGRPEMLAEVVAAVTERLVDATEEARNECRRPLEALNRTLVNNQAAVSSVALEAVLTLPDEVGYCERHDRYGEDGYEYDSGAVDCRPAKAAAREELRRRGSGDRTT